MADISLNISIAGSGRVARAMGHAFKSAGHTIVQIISRTPTDLAAELNAENVNFNGSISKVDIIAVLVSDDSISEVSSLLPSDIPQFHASGVTDIEKLHSETRGVFWPIKSINNKSSSEGFSGVPMGIESSKAAFLKTLSSLVSSINGDAFEADSSKRAIVHLAAVFTDNFANHCLTLSQEVLKNADLDPKLMRSLAEGLLAGALNGDSKNRQTGVAIRGDFKSQKRHVELLNTESAVEFYKFISKKIAEYHELQDKA